MMLYIFLIGTYLHIDLFSECRREGEVNMKQKIDASTVQRGDKNTVDFNLN